MKIPSLRLAAALLGLTLTSHGQTGEEEKADPSAPRAEITLSPEQIDMLTKQLAELEGQISKLRGDNLGQILQKLRAAAASNSSALAFYIECEKLVNISRKDLDRDQTKRLEERIDRGNDRRAVNEKLDGDPSLAARLQLQYLILCLEAHEAQDRAALIPRLQAYIQDLVSSADKLKGRAYAQLAGDMAGGATGAQPAGGGAARFPVNPVVSAYQLQRYLKAENWTNDAADVRGMWSRTLLPWYKDNKPAELTAQWDQCVNSIAALRKAVLSEAEYALWLQNDLPALRWERAEYLAQNGTTPVNALADMLKLIKEFPGHADAPKWLAGLRAYLGSAAGDGE